MGLLLLGLLELVLFPLMLFLVVYANCKAMLDPKRLVILVLHRFGVIGDCGEVVSCHFVNIVVF